MRLGVHIDHVLADSHDRASPRLFLWRDLRFGRHFLPYWPIWLESRGLGTVEIGLIIGASFWPRIVTSLVVPNLADRFGRRRLAMTLTTALTLIGLLAFALVSEFWLFMLLSLLTGATWSCILPLADAISLDRTASAGLDYGRVRLWGSITFILMSIIGGFASGARRRADHLHPPGRGHRPDLGRLFFHARQCRNGD